MSLESAWYVMPTLLVLANIITVITVVNII